MCILPTCPPALPLHRGHLNQKPDYNLELSNSHILYVGHVRCVDPTAAIVDTQNLPRQSEWSWWDKEMSNHQLNSFVWKVIGQEMCRHPSLAESSTSAKRWVLLMQSTGTHVQMCACSIRENIQFHTLYTSNMHILETRADMIFTFSSHILTTSCYTGWNLCPSTLSEGVVMCTMIVSNCWMPHCYL